MDLEEIEKQGAHVLFCTLFWIANFGIEGERASNDMYQMILHTGSCQVLTIMEPDFTTLL